MDLPPISSPAQKAILVILSLEHVVAILLFLANFPLDLRILRLRISLIIDELFKIIRPSREKQLDEEAIPAQSVANRQCQTRFQPQPLRPRWPFLSSIASISPRSREASTPSTWNASVIRRRVASDATTTPTPANTATPIPSSSKAPKKETGTAYSTSVSLSPYPAVTPSPIRRFMKTEGMYSPSVYPPLSTGTVKRDRGVEMLSPSVYSPASSSFCRYDEDGDTIAGARRDVAGDGGDGLEKDVPRGQSSLTPVVKAVRPRRYFDPRREFETVTPESVEKGSIVIGLGGGLSSLVGTGALNGGLRSVSQLGEKPGSNAELDGLSDVHSRALTSGADSEKTIEGAEFERFATPVFDDDTDKRVDGQSTRALDPAREENQPVPLLGFVDRAIAAVAYLLASTLDDGAAPDAESGLLVKPHDLSSFLPDS